MSLNATPSSERVHIGIFGKRNAGNGTLARSRKDSFYWYKKVIASDGEDLA